MIQKFQRIQKESRITVIIVKNRFFKCFFFAYESLYYRCKIKRGDEMKWGILGLDLIAFELS